MFCMSETDKTFPLLLNKPIDLAIFWISFRECLPVAYRSNNFRTSGERSGSGTTICASLSFRYPTGAQPGHSPRRNFCRSPRFVFSERLSTKYFDWPKVIFNMNFPCGVGSNQSHAKGVTLRCLRKKKGRRGHIDYSLTQYI